jgi:hypothetical protein
MSDFKREDRYTVVKISDAIAHLTTDEKRTLNLILAKVSIGRTLAKKPDLKCVVVESDWPEYEGVWQQIEARCTSL